MYPAVVEYVFSTTRFKVSLPRENCKLMFALQGVRGAPRGDAGGWSDAGA